MLKYCFFRLILFIVVILTVALPINPLLAEVNVVRKNISIFGDILSVFNENNLRAQNTLIHFDIDQTLIRTENYFGSENWYKICYQLAKVKASADKNSSLIIDTIKVIRENGNHLAFFKDKDDQMLASFILEMSKKAFDSSSDFFKFSEMLREKFINYIAIDETVLPTINKLVSEDFLMELNTSRSNDLNSLIRTERNLREASLDSFFNYQEQKNIFHRIHNVNTKGDVALARIASFVTNGQITISKTIHYVMVDDDPRYLQEIEQAFADQEKISKWGLNQYHIEVLLFHLKSRISYSNDKNNHLKEDIFTKDYGLSYYQRMNR